MFAQSSSHREIIYKRSKIIFHNRNVIVFDQNIMFWLPTGSYLAGFYFKIETQIRSWPHYFKLKRASDLDPHSLSWGPGSRSWNRISLSADPDQGKQKIVPKEKCVSYLSGSRRTSIRRIHEDWGSRYTSLLRTYFLHVTRLSANILYITLIKSLYSICIQLVNVNYWYPASMHSRHFVYSTLCNMHNTFLNSLHWLWFRISGCFFTSCEWQ